MDVRITVLLLLFQVARWFSDILNYLIAEYRAEAVESRYMALLVRSTPEREVLVRAMADDIVSCSSASASLQPSSETQGLLAGTMEYLRASDILTLTLVYFKSWRAGLSSS